MIKDNSTALGIALIISSPSGAGKSSLSKALIKHNQNTIFSVSMTTRPRRHSEVDGIDYIFVDERKFKQNISNNNFLEYTTVFSYYYGTLKSSVVDTLNQGKNIIFDIDWQGARELKKSLKKHAVSIYILPPSIRELEKRLKDRNSDNDHTISKRMAKVKDEMVHCHEYDYVVVNDDFDHALYALQSILIAEQHRTSKTNIDTDKII